jgi:hypothetical protein
MLTVRTAVVPRCFGQRKFPTFLRWQLRSVPWSLHQRAPENVCAGVSAAPAAQLTSSASVQNSGAM